MKWLSLTGRATRSQWWGANVVGFIAAMFVAIGVGHSLASAVDDELSAGILYVFLIVLASLAYLVISFSATIRRLHDRGRSGWFYLVYLVLNLIPVVNFISWIAYLIDMGFLDGVHGPNQWGEDPKGRKAFGHAETVVVAVAQNATSNVVGTTGARFCTHCGTAIEPSAQFCSNCGKSIG